MTSIFNEQETGLQVNIALNKLVEGNKHFVENILIKNDKPTFRREEGVSTEPFAVILSCLDMKQPVEIIFNQTIGSLFNITITGNSVNSDVLGSLEYACKFNQCKIILVLGHTNCKAIDLACDHLYLDNLDATLKNIKTALKLKKINSNKIDSKNKDDISLLSTYFSIIKIKEESKLLAEMEQDKKILILGGIYNENTGKVKFFSDLN